MLPKNRNNHGSCAGSSASGFSLIEVLMVIALMGIVFVLVIPNFTVVPSTEASAKINGLAGDIRAAYDMAVLHRKPHRIVFEFKTADYWLESTERVDFQLDDQQANHDPSPEEVKELTEQFEEDFKEYVDLAGKEVKDQDTEQVIKPASPLLSARDRLKPTVWKPIEDSEWSRRHLGPSFLLRSMQTEHHKVLQTYEDLQQDGYAYLYFFPNGYVERAVIYVAPADEDDKTRWDQLTYTVTTRPYEGTAEIETGFKEVDVSRDAKPR